MITSTFDLAATIGAAVMLPLIIGANLNSRQSGLMGYLWRENPWLPRIGLAFLCLVWLSAVAQLAQHYGWLSEDAGETALTALGLPILAMSLAILVMSGLELRRYLKSRRGG